jgi:hypothetical protein
MIVGNEVRSSFVASVTVQVVALDEQLLAKVVPGGASQE